MTAAQQFPDDLVVQPPPAGASGIARLGAITTQWELVSAAVAEAYLATRGPNRALMGGTVLRLSEDMSADRWITTHQGIAFDAAGHLIDGQHRLQAIIQSGRPQVLLVTRGLSDEAIQATDIGAKRYTAQLLQVLGWTHSHALAGALSAALLYREGRLRRGVPYPTVQDQLAFFAAHRAIADSVPWVNVCQLHGNVLPHSLVVWLHWELTPVAPALVDGFFQELLTGQDITSDDPTYGARQWLVEDRRGKFARRQRFTLAGVVFKAWNATLAEQPLRLPKEGMRPDEPLPSILSRHT
jgi:hypothetical protein